MAGRQPRRLGGRDAAKQGGSQGSSVVGRQLRHFGGREASEGSRVSDMWVECLARFITHADFALTSEASLGMTDAI